MYDNFCLYLWGCVCVCNYTVSFNLLYVFTAPVYILYRSVYILVSYIPNDIFSVRSADLVTFLLSHVG